MRSFRHVLAGSDDTAYSEQPLNAAIALETAHHTTGTGRAWLWAISPKHYPVFEKTGTLALRRVGRKALNQIQPGDIIFAYLSGAQVLAGMFEAVSTAFEDTTPLVRGKHLPHRLRVRTIVALTEEEWMPYAAFHDRLDVVREYQTFRSVVQQVIHPLPKVDEKVLEFMVRGRKGTGPDEMIGVLNEYLKAQKAKNTLQPVVREEATFYETPTSFDRAPALESLLDWIQAKGFVYEPWEVAAYITALRTKPFVILAGVSGTGKSKLPALVSEGTGGVARLIPVHPDWADSAEVLGYVDLQGRFRPGAVLRVAREAQTVLNQQITCILDEMNVARVEHYFAEVLSKIEDRRAGSGTGFESPPLLDMQVALSDAVWNTINLPANFAIVGTVNMDESTHGFSRKVLDRAFTLELADVDLATWSMAAQEELHAGCWPVAAWQPRAMRLSALQGLNTEEVACVQKAVDVLATVNTFLAPAQAQVAYRTRDEVALFALHARDVLAAFRTRGDEPVDPLDLALHMKVLPRLAGGGQALRAAMLGMLGWAITGEALKEEQEAQSFIDAWEKGGRQSSLPEARFPRTAARLCLMWERLVTEGFTSFWV